MENRYFSIKIRRCSFEYINSIILSITGFLMSYMLIFERKSLEFFVILFITISVLHACKLILIFFRPLVKLDAELLLIHPNFYKKIAIRKNDIKGLRMYENIIKTILTPQQAKQNDTLIIDLIDGKSITVRMRWLTKKVRQKISELAKAHDLPLEYLKSGKTHGVVLES